MRQLSLLMLIVVNVLGCGAALVQPCDARCGEGTYQDAETCECRPESRDQHVTVDVNMSSASSSTGGAADAGAQLCRPRLVIQMNDQDRGMRHVLEASSMRVLNFRVRTTCGRVNLYSLRLRSFISPELTRELTRHASDLSITDFISQVEVDTMMGGFYSRGNFAGDGVTLTNVNRDYIVKTEWRDMFVMARVQPDRRGSFAVTVEEFGADDVAGNFFVTVMYQDEYANPAPFLNAPNPQSGQITYTYWSIPNEVADAGTRVDAGHEDAGPSDAGADAGLTNPNPAYVRFLGQSGTPPSGDIYPGQDVDFGGWILRSNEPVRYISLAITFFRANGSNQTLGNHVLTGTRVKDEVTGVDLIARGKDILFYGDACYIDIISEQFTGETCRGNGPFQELDVQTGYRREVPVRLFGNVSTLAAPPDNYAPVLTGAQYMMEGDPTIYTVDRFHFSLNARSVVIPARLDAGSGDASALPDAGFSGVRVELSLNTPVSRAIPGGATYADLLELIFVNTTSQWQYLTGITVERTGVMAESELLGLVVHDDAGTVHGSLVNFAQGFATSTFASDPILIGPLANGAARLAVFLSSSVASGTIGLRLNATSITGYGEGGNATSIQGDYPLSGNMSSIVSGLGALGYLSVESRATIGGRDFSPVEIAPAALDVDIARFRLTENTGNESTALSNLTLYNYGYAYDGDLTDIRLVNGNDLVIAVGRFRNSVLHFSCFPQPILGGQYGDFTVRANVTSNPQAAGHTFNLVVRHDWDVRAIGQETGVGTGVSSGLWSTFPVGDYNDPGANFAKIAGTPIIPDGGVPYATMVVSRAAESNSGTTYPGATNVSLATFDLAVTGADVEVQEIGFVVLDQNGNGQAVGRKTLYGTLKINNASGAMIFAATASDTSIYGAGGCTVQSNTFTTSCYGWPSSKVLSTFLSIPANTTGKLTFVADINQSATSADGYTVRLTSCKFRNTVTNTFTTMSLQVDGHPIGIVTP